MFLQLAVGGLQTRPNPSDDTEKYTLPSPITTNALKIEGNDSYSDLYYSVSEIQVFGSASFPEPVTMLLLSSGLIGLAGYGRRRFLKK